MFTSYECNNCIILNKTNVSFHIVSKSKGLAILIWKSKVFLLCSLIQLKSHYERTKLLFWYYRKHHIQVPDNKIQLSVKYEHFPGQDMTYIAYQIGTDLRTFAHLFLKLFHYQRMPWRNLIKLAIVLKISNSSWTLYIDTHLSYQFTNVTWDNCLLCAIYQCHVRQLSVVCYLPMSRETIVCCVLFTNVTW
jgi:hypothetical protein